jgi:methionine sulfoxide reductase heme-binding subunit
MNAIRLSKPFLFAACLVPAALLTWNALHDALGANPISEITHTTGDWTLRFLLITLAITPVRKLTGWNPIIRYRRMVGLFAFFYATLHFLTYVVLDQGLGWSYILADIAKRPYITVGFLGFVLLVPLALTSTTGWIRRLGKRWQQLHRLIYVTAIAGIVHYWWLVKSDISRPLAYGAILAVLFAIRLWYVSRKRSSAPARAAGAVATRSNA